MRTFSIALLFVVCVVSQAYAQTKGHVSVGASVSFIKPTSDQVDSVVSIGPLVRLNPRRGWGPAGALNWFRVNIDNPSGDTGDFARLRIRPLMVGIAYTVGSSPVLTSFSIVAGPSFNSIDFEDDFLDRIPANVTRPTIDIENSIAVRPGVNVTWTVAPRVAIVGFAGYLINRPDTVYRDTSGREFRNQWKADSTVLSVSAVYSIF